MSIISDTLRHVLQKIAEGETPEGFERVTTSLSRADAEQLLFLDSFHSICRELVNRNCVTTANILAALYPGPPHRTFDISPPGEKP
jgi:hypothetical protein